MKIYIAGKITDLKDYKIHFDNAESKLASEGHSCMNPTILPSGFEWGEYMQICFKMIDVCEAVYMLKNWFESKGATLEHEYAINKNKKIIYE